MIVKTGIGPKLLLLSLTVCFSSAYLNIVPNYYDKFLIGSKSNYPTVEKGDVSTHPAVKEIPARNSIVESSSDLSPGLSAARTEYAPKHVANLNRKLGRRKEYDDLFLYDLKHDEGKFRKFHHHRFRGKRSSKKPKPPRKGKKKVSSSSSSSSSSEEDNSKSGSDSGSSSSEESKKKKKSKRDISEALLSRTKRGAGSAEDADTATGLAKKDKVGKEEKSSRRRSRVSASSNSSSPLSSSNLTSSEEMVTMTKKDLEKLTHALKRHEPGRRRGHVRRHGGRRKSRRRGRGRKSSKRGKYSSRRHKGRGRYESTSGSSSSSEEVVGGPGPMGSSSSSEEGSISLPKTSLSSKKGMKGSGPAKGSSSSEENPNNVGSGFAGTQQYSMPTDDFQMMMMMEGMTDLTRDMKDESDMEMEREAEAEKKKKQEQKKKEESEEESAEPTIAIAITRRRKRSFDYDDEVAFQPPFPLDNGKPEHSQAIAKDRAGDEGTLALTVNGVHKHNGPYDRNEILTHGEQHVTAFATDWRGSRNAVAQAYATDKRRPADAVADTHVGDGTAAALSQSSGGGSLSSAMAEGGDAEAVAFGGTNFQLQDENEAIEDLVSERRRKKREINKLSGHAIFDHGNPNTSNNDGASPSVPWPTNNHANVVGGSSTPAPVRTKKFKKKHHHKKSKHHKGHRHGVTLVVMPIMYPPQQVQVQQQNKSESTQIPILSSLPPKAIDLSGILLDAVNSESSQPSHVLPARQSSVQYSDMVLNGAPNQAVRNGAPQMPKKSFEFSDLLLSPEISENELLSLGNIFNNEFDENAQPYRHRARHIRVRREKSRSKYRDEPQEEHDEEAAPTLPPPPPPVTRVGAPNEDGGGGGPPPPPTSGSIANAKTETGKAQATAVSKTGGAKATALNGTSANALALTAHETGQALATADTHGDDGSKASAFTRGKGNATGSATSRGQGDSTAVAIAAKGGSARADAQSRKKGNATSNAVANTEGGTISDSLSKDGSSAAFSVSKGTGPARANSLAGTTGESRSLAQSSGGNVIANSRTLGTGEAISVGATKGKGDTLSNAVSKNGAAEADALAEKGDSVANAMNGSGEFTFTEDELALDEGDHESLSMAARKKRALSENVEQPDRK